MIPDHIARVPQMFPAVVGALPPKVLAYELKYHPPTGGWFRPGGELRFGAVEVEVGRLWYSLVMLLRPNLILETGTHEGYSTACIAAALRMLGTPAERRLITIDPEPLEQCWDDTELAPHITLLKKKSQEAAAELAGSVFDMLILDSDHHYDTIMDELILYEPMLTDGGVILLHDVLFFDGVGKAVRQLAENPRFEVVTLDSPRHHDYGSYRPPGVTLVRKKRSGQPALFFDVSAAGTFAGDIMSPAYLRQFDTADLVPPQVVVPHTVNTHV